MAKRFSLDKVAIRLVKEPPLKAWVPFTEPTIVAKVMAEELGDYDREVVAVVNLRADLRPINVNIVSVGTLEQSLIHPRELLKSTILSNASSIIMVHNHPSGSMKPSVDDIKITDRMLQICQLMGIGFLDHIIVSRGREYYSFKEKDVLPLPNIKFANGLEEINLGGMNVAENTNFTNNSVDSTEKRERFLAQMKEITDKLEKGVTEIFNSESYKQFLNTMAKFPRYSVNNNLLIMMQKPEAQLCQSFSGWKQMGRNVKKGEKGIKIIAPSPYMVEREMQKIDNKGNPIMGADGNPVMETKSVQMNGFKVVHTFDVSQTEGKELPTVGVDELQGEVKDYEKLFEVIKETSPVPIEVEAIKDGSKGYYSRVENKIVLNEGMSEVQNVKTLIHEIAHAKLHSESRPKDEKTRNSKEVEAESVAYTVCQHYGIDTSDYSFSYVVGWSGSKEVPELKASLDTIRSTAADMITAIDEKYQEMTVDKNQEKQMEEKQPLTQEVAKEEKPKKESIKSKLKEGKEKVAKTPVKKAKEKGEQERV